MNKLIKPVTSDHDLLQLGDRLDIDLDGILTIDECDPDIVSDGSYIILLQGEEGAVGHWVCMIDGLYFDSTGIGPPQSLGVLPYSKKQFQSAYAEFCGVWCVFWLYCQQKNQMDLLDQFVDLNIEVI